MFVWDIVFLARCFCCGYVGTYLCTRCFNKLVPLFTQRCLYCGLPSPHGLTHPGCRKKNGVDGRVSLYKYNQPLRKIIMGIKYSLVKESKKDLFYVVGARAQAGLGFYMKNKQIHIQPIPLSAQKEKIRGFNQSLMIAANLAILFEAPVLNLLKRVKNNPPQAKLARGERKINIKGAFAFVGGEAPRQIILVDDVVTTGQTMMEAAKALKVGGVEKVYGFSVAKG